MFDMDSLGRFVNRGKWKLDFQLKRREKVESYIGLVLGVLYFYVLVQFYLVFLVCEWDGYIDVRNKLILLGQKQ